MFDYQSLYLSTWNERIWTNLRLEAECGDHFVKLTVPRSNQWSVGKFGQVLVTAAAATNPVNHVLPISGGLSAFPGLDYVPKKYQTHTCILGKVGCFALDWIP